MTRSPSMKLLLVAHAACGGSTASVVTNAAKTPVAMALPADRDLGELGLMPLDKRDDGSWLPAGPGPIVVEGALREGKPSWTAFDQHGNSAPVTYGGLEVNIPYGCDNNSFRATHLDGDPDATLKPGLVWLRPLDQKTPVTSLAIQGTATPTAARRDYAIGPVTLELARTGTNTGVAKLAWRGRQVLAQPFERSHMEGADTTTPLDLVEGGVAVPVPEAAWTIGDGVVLIALRVQSYEGLHLQALVVNAETGRAVEPMGVYIYQCAF